MIYTRFSRLAILLAAFAAIGCDDKQNAAPTAAAPARPPSPVQVATAITRDVPVYLDEIGSCTAMETVSVRPQAAGRITGIHFADGADIKKGQLLFTIDARPYQAMLDQSTAGLAQAKANLALAQQQLTNAQAAISANAISREELQTRQNTVTVANAQIQLRQAEIETAKVNLEYCTINSPLDARAGKRLVDVGNVVKANDDNPLLILQRMDPIYADFTIPETNLTEVRNNFSSGILQTLVKLPEDPAGSEHKGQLTFLDNSVQDGTGTIHLRATLPNADRHFWPGQFVEVRLVLSVKKDAVLIPSMAQQVGQQGPFVYVVKESSVTGLDGKPLPATAQLTPITLGQRQGDLLVVEKGISKGDKVVTVGQMMIMPGGPVQIVPSAPPPGAPTTAPTSQPATH